MASRFMASRMMMNARLPIIISGMRGFSTSLSLHAPRTRNLKEFSMAGKVAMVTGVARGLGNTFCRAFIEAGCNSIAIVDLRKEDAQAAADALIADYLKYGIIKDGEVTALGFGCDVASEESVRTTVKQVESQLGLVDTLVTAACIVPVSLRPPLRSLIRLSRRNCRKLSGYRLPDREDSKGVRYQRPWVLLLCQGSGKATAAGKGQGEYRIHLKKHIDCESTAGDVASLGVPTRLTSSPKFQTPYNASKSAVQHMASSLAVEWAKTGIRVNAISPGYMMTKLTSKMLDENPELKESWHTMTPMGRMGQPEELKGAVVFLASDASSYVTGSEIRVDGGYCCV